jgi:hypothetical protein
MKPEDLKLFAEGALASLYAIEGNDYREHVVVTVAENKVRFWYEIIEDLDDDEHKSDCLTLEYYDPIEFAKEVVNVQTELELIRERMPKI